MSTTLQTPAPRTTTVDTKVDTGTAQPGGDARAADLAPSVDRLVDAAKRFTRQLDEAGLSERERAVFFFD